MKGNITLGNVLSIVSTAIAALGLLWTINQAWTALNREVAMLAVKVEITQRDIAEVKTSIQRIERSVAEREPTVPQWWRSSP